MTAFQDAAAELRELVCFNLYLGWTAVQSMYGPHFDEDMTPQRLYILALLDRREPVTVTQIAEAMPIEKPAVSGLIDRMIADGLVIKRKSKQDARSVSVHLTAAGERKRAAHNERLETIDSEQFWPSVSRSDVAALRRLVATISGMSKEARTA